MHLDRLSDFKLHGAVKIFHHLFMILTYPFRHIVKFLVFIFVASVFLAAVPMIQGVRYTDIPSWYLLQYKNFQANIPAEQADVQPVVTQLAAEEKIAEVKAPEIIRRHSPEPEQNTLGKRRAFKPAVSFTQPEKKYKALNIQTENKINPVQNTDSQTISEPVQKNVQKEGTYYRKTDKLPLVYEETPQDVGGKTFVFSETELTVGDAYLILYGIAVSKQNQDQAHQYLKELADGKDLTCKIVAYTHHNIATGVCFLNGRSINQMMVDAGWAENIAL